jgi:DNA-binding response OmpR family regulator/DNA-binding CsgD family transcriptional regulator
MSTNPARPELQTILIVDDTPTNLRVAVDYLRAYSYRILIARDGETGIERAERGNPDLILMDVGLPGIDGYEACRRLKASPDTHDVPVIFMTALSDLRDKVRGFEAGGVDFVTKPVEEQELLARVRAQLRIGQLQRQLSAYTDQLEAEVSQSKADVVAHRREADRLGEVVRTQADRIRDLTGEFRHALDGGAPPAELRTSLLGAHLEQARDLLPPGDNDTIGARGHLLIALELLGTPDPAVVAQPREDPFRTLSQREREIVELLVEGYTTKEIAYELELARSTVSTHRKRLMDKVGVADLSSLIKLALGVG